MQKILKIRLFRGGLDAVYLRSMFVFAATELMTARGGIGKDVKSSSVNLQWRSDWSRWEFNFSFAAWPWSECAHMCMWHSLFLNSLFLKANGHQKEPSLEVGAGAHLFVALVLLPHQSVTSTALAAVRGACLGGARWQDPDDGALLLADVSWPLPKAVLKDNLGAAAVAKRLMNALSQHYEGRVNGLLGSHLCCRIVMFLL